MTHPLPGETGNMYRVCISWISTSHFAQCPLFFYTPILSFFRSPPLQLVFINGPPIRLPLFLSLCWTVIPFNCRGVYWCHTILSLFSVFCLIYILTVQFTCQYPLTGFSHQPQWNVSWWLFKLSFEVRSSSLAISQSPWQFLWVLHQAFSACHHLYHIVPFTTHNIHLMLQSHTHIPFLLYYLSAQYHDFMQMQYFLLGQMEQWNANETLLLSWSILGHSTSSTWEHCAMWAMTAPRVPQGAPEFSGEGDIATRASML